jgi:hypothetical protein
MHIGRRSGGWLGALCTTLVIAGVCFAPPSEANVYKWKDVQGRIHYTDRPPPPDGVLISVEQTSNVHRNDAPAPSRASTASPPPARSGNESLSPAQQAQLRSSVQNDVSAAQGEQCKLAQERYQSYVKSRRLYKEGDNKERVYLSDAELEEARVNAKREMDEACAGRQ